MAEHETRRGSRIERRLVGMLERFASHGALSLRNAWLLEQVQQLAATDALTGIANRKTFRQALDRELDRAPRAGDDVSLVMLDIDHFKRLNDELRAPGRRRGAAPQSARQLRGALRAATTPPPATAARSSRVILRRRRGTRPARTRRSPAPQRRRRGRRTERDHRRRPGHLPTDAATLTS